MTETGAGFHKGCGVDGMAKEAFDLAQRYAPPQAGGPGELEQAIVTKLTDGFRAAT
jgi:hypothetical protein